MSKLLEQINKEGRKTYFIKDMGRVVTGKTPSKENPNDWGNEIDFITPTDFSSNEKYLSKIKRKISPDGARRYKNMILPPESVVVTCIGSDMGKVIVSKNIALTNQQINSIVVNKDLFDLEFVFYVLKSLYPTLRSIAEEGGSTMPIITKSAFELIEFEAPDLPTQQKIAGILSGHDEKIENNNKIIKNLEATAQTIFNEWFVNFRFPGYEKAKFVESEMGEIPEGWEVSRISDVADLNKGVSYTSDEINTEKKGIALINLGNFKRGGGFNLNGTKYYTGDFKETHKVKPGQILIAMTDLTSNREVIGHPARLPGNFKNAVISLDVCSLTPKKGIYNEFIYSLMICRAFSKLMASCASGTNVSHLSRTHIEGYKFILPTENILMMFNNFVQALFKKQALLEDENIELKETRDQLLAKLI